MGHGNIKDWMRDKSVVKIPLERFKERESGSSRREWPWNKCKFQYPPSNCLFARTTACLLSDA